MIAMIPIVLIGSYAPLPPWSMFYNATPYVHNCKECFKLTDAQNTQRGCIWDDAQVDFSGPVEVEAIMNFGDKDAGADGICIAFSLTPDCGEGGGGIGANGIPGAVIIEFDTWDNGGGWGDIPADHVSVDINGNVQVPVLGPASLGNIEDGNDHTVRFSWDGAGGINIYFDGALVLSGSFDLVGALGGSVVYLGYTASTGGANNQQIVCPENIPVPGPDPAIFTQFDLEVCEGETGVIYAVQPVPNVTYQWTVPSGASLNGSGASIAINWGSTGGDVCVELDNGCGVSDTVCVTVEVTLLPDVDPESPAPLCEEEFDLSTIPLQNVEPGHIITYHPSQIAAQQGFPDLGTPPIVNLSGTYWLRIEAGDGCVQIVPVDVVLEYPEIIVEQPDPVCAQNGVELQTVIVIEVNGIPLVLHQFFNSAADAYAGMNPLVNTYITQSGTYWVRATTANDCYDIAAIEVIIWPKPELDVETPPALCDGDTFYFSDLVITEKNGMDPASYTLSYYLTEAFAIVGTPEIDPPVATTSGTYWIRMTTQEGCFDVFPVTITFVPAPVVLISTPSKICEGEMMPITFEFAGQPPYVIQYTNGKDTFSFQSDISPHSEWILAMTSDSFWIISFKDGAPAVCNPIIGPGVSFTVNPKVGISQPEITCIGLSYQVTFNLITGDTASWVVSGSTGTITNASFQSSLFASGTPFQFVIWDKNGCDTITFSGIPDCSCTTKAGTYIEPLIHACLGDTVWLTFAQDGVLDSNDVRNFVLYQGTPFQASTYLQWRDQPFFVFDPSTMMTDVTYYAMVVAGDNNNGVADSMDICFSRGNAIPVTFHGIPTLQLPPDITVCVNDNFSIAISVNGNSPFNIAYSVNGGATQLQSGGGNTVYMPVVTDASKSIVFSSLSDAWCSSNLSDTFFLTVNQGPNVSNISFDCNNDNSAYVVSFMISGGDPSSYSVSGGGTLNGNFFQSQPIPVGSNYNFVIDDVFGCKPFSVSGNYLCQCLTEAGQIPGGPFTICEGDTLTIQHTGIYLEPNDTMLWYLCTNPNDIKGSVIWKYSSRDIFYPGLPIVFGVDYYLAGVGGNTLPGFGVDEGDICLDTSNVVVIRFSAIPIISGFVYSPNSFFTCVDTLISVMVEVSGGPFNYSWSTQDGSIIGTTTDQVIQAGKSGWYEVTVTNASGGCKTIQSILLEDKSVYPNAIIAPPGTLNCVNQTILLDGSGSSSGPGVEIEWTTVNGNFLQGQQGLNPMIGSAGTYTLTLTDTISQCKASASVIVMMDTIPPIADAGMDAVIPCGTVPGMLDGSASTGQGLLSYQWSAITGSLSGPNMAVAVLPSGKGTYALLVTDSFNGCTSSDTVSVFEGDGLRDLTWDLKPPPCFGMNQASIGNIGISGGTPPYYMRIGSQEIPIPGKISGLTAGTFTVQIRDAAGCEWDTTVILIAPPPLNVVAGPDAQISFGESYTLLGNITGGTEPVRNLWMSNGDTLCSNCLSINVTPELTTTYQLQVEDANGCIASSQMSVAVRMPRDVYIPTSFSPNYDGINDIFSIYGGPTVAGVHYMAVFDRWGNAVFELGEFLADGTQGWDGTYRDGLMDPGVYVWYAQIVYIDGVVRLFKGDVTLVR